MVLAVLAPPAFARLRAASSRQAELGAASSTQAQLGGASSGQAQLGASSGQARASVSTLIGNGVAGLSDAQVNNPYGLVFGPDGALYFCDLDNQRIRRLDLTTRRTATIAGNGPKGYAGDGGAATEAALNMPHEIEFDAAGHLYIAERDNHVIRKVEARTGMISTFAGTGTAGFAGDGGPAACGRPAPAAQHCGGPDRRPTAHLRHRQPPHPGGRSRQPASSKRTAAQGRGCRHPTAHRSRARRSMVRGPWRSIRAATFIWRCGKGNAVVSSRCRDTNHSPRRGNRGAGILGRRWTGAGSEAGRTEGPRLVARRLVCRRHRESRDSSD